MKMNFGSQQVKLTTAPKKDNADDTKAISKPSSSAQSNTPQEIQRPQTSVGLKIGGRIIAGGTEQKEQQGTSERISEKAPTVKENASGSSAQTSIQTTGLTYPNQPESVPAELLKDFEQAKQTLANQLQENTEMIGYALRRIMIDLRTHPELTEFLSPRDMGNMVRALRVSYGNALVIKEKKARGKKKKDNSGDLNLVDLSDIDVAGLD